MKDYYKGAWSLRKPNLDILLVEVIKMQKLTTLLVILMFAWLVVSSVSYSFKCDRAVESYARGILK